jgi:hypothetical protein
VNINRISAFALDYKFHPATLSLSLSASRLKKPIPVLNHDQNAPMSGNH